MKSHKSFALWRNALVAGTERAFANCSTGTCLASSSSSTAAVAFGQDRHCHWNVPMHAPLNQRFLHTSHSSEQAGTAGRDMADRIGPAVRMGLQAAGLIARDVKASGPNGIVTKGDVLAAIQAGVKGSSVPVSPPAAEQAAEKPASAKAPESTAAESSPAGGAPERFGPRGESYVDIPNTTMRKVIAKRLLESKLTTPATYISHNIDLGNLITLRESLKARGQKASVNDFVIKAVATALRECPEVCAGWDAKSEEPLLYDTVDISIAVSIPAGLITPIVTDADKKTVFEIGASVKDLAGRARANKLAPHEFTGGSFTISNLGMFGVDEFSAIINPPQACILAVGGTRERTVLGDGGLVRQQYMTVTLSADSRVVGQDTAADFLTCFAKNIENPAMLWL